MENIDEKTDMMVLPEEAIIRQTGLSPKSTSGKSAAKGTKNSCKSFLFMLHCILVMEKIGVLHLNFSCTVKRKINKNKIFGGNYENQKIREKAHLKQRNHCQFKK
jgi:hypothetical protein